NTLSANATYFGPKCFGNFLPSQSNSGLPKRCPIPNPIESPATAPAEAQTATHTGEMSKLSREDSSAAEINVISPGNGMPRLSTMITTATIRYTASAGIDCSSCWINGCPYLTVPTPLTHRRRHARSDSHYIDLTPATTPGTREPSPRPTELLGTAPRPGAVGLLTPTPTAARNAAGPVRPAVTTTTRRTAHSCGNTTPRPRNVPAASCSYALPADASGNVVTSAAISPRAANASTSRSS